MKSELIITVSGEDTHGVMGAVSSKMAQLGADDVTFRMLRREGQFTSLVKCKVEKGKEGKFHSELSSGYESLHFSSVPAESAYPNRNNNIVSLVINCENRPGVRKDLATVFSNLEFDILKLDSGVLPVIGIGQTVFSAQCTLKVPDNLSAENVADEIEMCADGARVSVV